MALAQGRAESLLGLRGDAGGCGACAATAAVARGATADTTRGAAIMTDIEKLFEQRRATPSDINEHMDALRCYAMLCSSICEFGVRSGNSTVAFLAGLDAVPAGLVLHSF